MGRRFAQPEIYGATPYQLSVTYYLIIYIYGHPMYVEATRGRVTVWWQQTGFTRTEINNYLKIK
jgi:hypothetical protein